MDYQKNQNEQYIEKMEREFQRVAQVIQDEIMRVVVNGIVGYALNEAGRIVFSATSASAQNAIIRLSSGVMQRARPNLLQRILSAFGALFDRGTKYYRGMGLNPANEDEARRRLLLLYGYDETTGEVTPGSYIDALLNTATMQVQLGRALAAGIQAQDTLPQYRARIRAAVVGTQGRPGMVEAHVKRLAGDTMAAYDQTIKDDYAERLGLRYFVYAGTAEKDSRPFCLARLNRVYTKDELKKWDSRDWKGKNRTLPVRIARGGYNCRHAYNWVTDAIAERIIKQRGAANTYDASIPGRGEI